jgi:DNA-directed RNA polymerase II subunit RPB1
MSLFQEMDYNSNIERVKKIQFSILSPEEIVKRSVAEIFTQETYENDNAKIGGLFDPRMGVLDNGKICPTDQLSNRLCPGYFGHINLAQPVFYIHYQKYIINILQCVCWKCSKLLIDASDKNIQPHIQMRKGSKRFKFVLTKCKKVKRCGEKNCNGCGTLAPTTIKKELNGIGKLVAIWKSKKSDEEKDIKFYWNASDVLKIFKRISDEDINAMGFSSIFSRPEWLICTVFGVAPPSVRPSVRSDNNSRMEDDLTHKLCDIIKTNRTLKYKLEQKAAKKIIDEWYQLLQYHIATFVDNTIPGIPPAQQRSGRSLKSIKERLKAKQGRVRGNLMGKRVDFSARSVITPDPNIGINELGVPLKIAKNLTYPDTVTKYNYDILSSYVKNGYDTYPGVKSIKRKRDGRMVCLKVIDTDLYELEIGDIVNRHLIDGDYVLFNRQPSLHKMSMMAHVIKVLPYNTFRLNVNVTTPYNADFDGDEMNMHVPQSIQTRNELKNLALVQTQIITPAQHRPIIGLVQDSIIGSFLLTKETTFLTYQEVSTIITSLPDFKYSIPKPTIHKNTPVKQLLIDFPNFPLHTFMLTEKDLVPIDLWSGSLIFSQIIPNININKKTSSLGGKNYVSIDKGQLKMGVLDKSLLGPKSQGIIHVIHNDYGADKTREFLDNSQTVLIEWMLMSGFSVGLSDLMVDNESKSKMQEVIISKKRKVIEIIEQVHNGLLKNNTGKDNSNEFEIQILKHLNAATAESGNMGLKYLSAKNRMSQLVDSGSKGSKLNIGQMIACVGQQSVDGKRLPYGFRDRTLPHFHKYDDGAAARGFVENSFIKGLNPIEFFFHAMGGREGLIDTAVKTSETGYIQRKLVKGMENIHVRNDYTVRNSNGHIVQFLYGEDGVDATKIEKDKLITVEMTYDAIYKEYHLSVNDNWKLYLDESTYETFTSYPITVTEHTFDRYYTQIIKDKKFFVEELRKYDLTEGGSIYIQINMKRLLMNTQKMFQNKNIRSDIDPIFIIEKIKELENKLKINEYNTNNKLLMMIIRAYLSPKKLIQEYNFNRLALDYIVGHIYQQFFSSICQPGELVGIISAQSIGEPSTQMTLNTFHFAGISSKSQVTRGLGRFKEVLSATRKIKSPYLTVYLKEDFKYNKFKATQVINDIAIIKIKDLVVSTEIYYENEINITGTENDLMSVYKIFDAIDQETTKDIINPWVLSIELNKKKLLDKNIKMIDIYYKIISKFNNDYEDISCIFSDDNSDQLIFKIQCINKSTTAETDQEGIIELLKILETTILHDLELSGVRNIINASMSKYENVTQYDEETNNYVKKPEWVIDTTGSNLLEIYNHPAVDAYKTISNDIHEVMNVFGIEAARSLIINEIHDIFEQSSSNVNFRHLALLADVMTNKGYIMSIDRHGINKSNRGPLAKCSFEETPDIILKAALFAETDNINGVSSNIMLGQEPPIGTGSIDILFDEQKYFESILELKQTTDDIESKEEYVEDSKSEVENYKQKALLRNICKPELFTENMFNIM